MSRKVVIPVAATGSIPNRKDNPHPPITAEEVTTVDVARSILPLLDKG
jgi:uncharacterized protein (DUF849 family)